MKAKSPRSDEDSNFNSLMSLLDQYQGFVRASGHRVFRSTPEEARRLLTGLSPHRKLNLLERLQTDVKVLSEAAAAGENLNDTRRLLWRFLQKSRLTPTSDLMDRIADGYIVEVYGTDQVHLWQNLTFFDWCSASLEQIYGETWYDVSVRDKSVQAQLMAAAMQIFTGEVKGTIAPASDFHLMEEIHTEMLLKFDIMVRVMSPLYMDGQVAGLISVNECRNLHGYKL